MRIRHLFTCSLGNPCQSIDSGKTPNQWRAGSSGAASGSKIGKRAGDVIVFWGVSPPGHLFGRLMPLHERCYCIRAFCLVSAQYIIRVSFVRLTEGSKWLNANWTMNVQLERRFLQYWPIRSDLFMLHNSLQKWLQLMSSRYISIFHSRNEMSALAYLLVYIRLVNRTWLDCRFFKFKTIVGSMVLLKPFFFAPRHRIFYVFASC